MPGGCQSQLNSKRLLSNSMETETLCTLLLDDVFIHCFHFGTYYRFWILKVKVWLRDIHNSIRCIHSVTSTYLYVCSIYTFCDFDISIIVFYKYTVWLWHIQNCVQYTHSDFDISIIVFDISTVDSQISLHDATFGQNVYPLRNVTHDGECAG